MFFRREEELLPTGVVEWREETNVEPLVCWGFFLCMALFIISINNLYLLLSFLFTDVDSAMCRLLSRTF